MLTPVIYDSRYYDLATSLIGREVIGNIHEWSMDIYHAGHLVDSFPRKIGQKSHCS